MAGRTVFKILKAHNGDSLILTTYTYENSDFTIVVDGGTSQTFNDTLRNELSAFSQIDLLILTHIDSDHIGGLLRFFKSSLFHKISIKLFWINLLGFITINSGDKISMGQAKTLEELLIEKQVEHSKIVQNITFENQPKQLDNGIGIFVLSPPSQLLEELKENARQYLILDKKRNAEKIKISTDTSLKCNKIPLNVLAKAEFTPSSIVSDKINGSSIGLLITALDSTCLLLGDCRAEIIEQSLLINGYSRCNKLKVNLVKISHHGSVNNTSCSLLDLIDCNHFVISTNGGTSDHGHPDREVIARIIHHPERNYNQHRRIYFNYSLEQIRQRAGDFISDHDFAEGNWSFMDNVEQLTLRELI